MRSLQVVSAEAREDSREATVVFELEAVPALCNPMGRLHGGAVALIADMTTTMATSPISKRDWWEFGGVTRTLGITMLAPIQRGQTIVIECMLRSIGKRLCKTQP